MDQVIDFKRGTTFEKEGQLVSRFNNVDTPIDISAYQITSEIYNGNTLIESITATHIDAANGKYKFLKSNIETADWPVNLLKWNIKFDNAGTITDAYPIYINVMGN